MDVQYHNVITRKNRRKIVYNKYKESVVDIQKGLCKWKGVEIIEGKAIVDYIHLSKRPLKRWLIVFFLLPSAKVWNEVFANFPV